MSESPEIPLKDESAEEYDQGDGGVGGGKGCRVYVGNLPYSYRWWELKDLAREVGEVVHTQVMVGPDGRAKGCGIIEFRTPKDAQKAIAELHDREVSGRPIFVREDREEFTVAKAGAQVFVQNLPFSARWQDLKDRFREIGAVAKADVLVHPDGRSKGVGTVLFEDPEDAQAAISKFNGMDWNGRRIEVREDKGPRGGAGGGYGGGGYRGRGGGGYRGGRGGGYAE